MADHLPEYFDELLKKNNLTPDEVNAAIDDVHDILVKMEKGLAILQEMGQAPEKKVLENQKKFKKVLLALEDYF